MQVGTYIRGEMRCTSHFKPRHMRCCNEDPDTVNHALIDKIPDTKSITGSKKIVRAEQGLRNENYMGELNITDCDVYT